MDRIGFLRRHVDLAAAVALEIGGLDKPVLDPHSTNVRFLDHLDTPSLKRKYQADPAVDKDRIVAVDYVWNAGGIADAVTDGERFDLIAASHAFEHFANPVQWFLDVRTLLSPDGMVFLALPDKRFTFDLMRRNTSLSDWVGWYLRQLDKPSAEQIFDHFANFCSVAADRAWRDPAYRSGGPSLEPGQAMDIARSAREEDRYVDAHCSVFTPFAFVGLCRDLDALGLFPFRIAGIAPTEPDDIEFLVLLQARDIASDAATDVRLGNAELQALAIAAGYAGSFGGGRFVLAMQADTALARRFKALEAAARTAAQEERRKRAAAFPELDRKLHHERPGADDPRIHRVGAWRGWLEARRRRT